MEGQRKPLDAPGGVRSGVVRPMAAGDSTLRRIKRCALQGRLRFTVKAQLELELDDLTREDVRESLLNAVAIYKTIRSARRGVGREYFHVIQIPNFDGVMNKLKI